MVSLITRCAYKQSCLITNGNDYLKSTSARDSTLDLAFYYTFYYTSDILLLEMFVGCIIISGCTLRDSNATLTV